MEVVGWRAEGGKKRRGVVERRKKRMTERQLKRDEDGWFHLSRAKLMAEKRGKEKRTVSNSGEIQSHLTFQTQPLRKSSRGKTKP